MIDWNEYDKDNPPTFEKNYLVLDKNKIATQASLENRGQFENAWREYCGGYIKNVTYYAEINLPKENPT